MKLFLIITLLLFATEGIAQDIPDHWTVKLNKKLLLSTSQEDEKDNFRKIKSRDWKKNGYLEINYKEADPGFWKRYFLFTDEDDNEAFRADSVTYSRIAIPSLRKLFAGKHQIRIYTMVSPLDTNMAVRIRRVHLCTLRIQ